jgi:hypothetical protein
LVQFYTSTSKSDTLHDVAEQERTLNEFREAGIIRALEWATKSAHDRAFLDFDPDTGHDQTVLGIMAHKLLGDRQDRVFRCGKFALPEEVDADQEESAADLLLNGLSPRDEKEMPRDLAGVAVRADVNGSPGWRYGHYHWFTTSYVYGEIDGILWGQKSPTKQGIAASMGDNSSDQLVLPHGPQLVAETYQTIAEALAEANQGDMRLMLAHAVDPVMGLTELYLGQARLNLGGGPAWIWRERLIGGDDPLGQRVHGPAPQPQDPDSVADAPVRLRPRVAENQTSRDIKGQ